MKGKLEMKYTLILNGEIHKKFQSLRNLAAYIFCSDLMERKYRSICFSGNTCEILACDK